MSNKLKKISCIIILALGLSIIPVEFASAKETPYIINRMTSNTTLTSATKKANTGIKLNTKELVLEIGKSKTLKVNNTKKKVTWKSTNPKIATVSKKGTVKGVTNGSVVIKAIVDGKTYECFVKVKGPNLSYSEVCVYVGEESRISLKDSNGEKVKWTISDSSVAAIDYVGDHGARYVDIEVKKVGTTTLNVKVGNINLTCNIKVIKKNNDLKKAAKKIRNLAKDYNLIIDSENQVEFYRESHCPWVALYDDYIGFVIPSYGTGEEDYLPILKEFIETTMPENGEKLYNWLIEDTLTTRQMVLEDKTVEVFEDRFYRVLTISNRAWN